MRIASLFHHFLTRAAAEGIIASQLGGLVGTCVFLPLNVGYPFTIPAKTVIAVGVVEAIGNAAYSYFEHTKTA